MTFVRDMKDRDRAYALFCNKRYLFLFNYTNYNGIRYLERGFCWTLLI